MRYKASFFYSSGDSNGVRNKREDSIPLWTIKISAGGGFLNNGRSPTAPDHRCSKAAASISSTGKVFRSPNRRQSGELEQSDAHAAQQQGRGKPTL